MTAIKGNLQFKGTFRHLPPLYTILQVATIKFSSFLTQNIFYFNNGNVCPHFVSFHFSFTFLPIAPKVLRQHWPCPGSRACSGSEREDDGLSPAPAPALGTEYPGLMPVILRHPGRLSHPVREHIQSAIIFIQTLESAGFRITRIMNSLSLGLVLLVLTLDWEWHLNV